MSTKLGNWGDYFTNFHIVNGELEEYQVYSWYTIDDALILRASVEHNKITGVTKFNEE